MKMGLVTSYFNPGNNPYQLPNYQQFYKRLGNYADRLITVCLDYGDEVTELPPGNIIRVKGNTEHHTMWQKEALLNIGIQNLSKEYDAYAWIDADIIFFGENWVERAEEMLEEFPVLQLFTHCKYAGKGGGYETERVSIASHGRSDKSGCFGMAWAARRDFTPTLYDRIITGSGDAYMAKAWYGQASVRKNIAPEVFPDYMIWASQFPKKVPVGCLQQKIEHLFHGEFTKRKYAARIQMMRNFKYNPQRDIVKEESGILRWTNKNRLIRNQVTRWMLNGRSA